MIISRYLTGLRDDIDVKESQDLITLLTLEQLWPKEILDEEENLNKELNYLRELKITIG